MRPTLAVVAGVLLAASTARAEPGEGEKKAAAQALFDEARALTQKGQHAEACPKLAESLRLDPSMGTRFYLAECFENTGKLASAWTYYLEVADAAKAAGQKDREKYAADRAEALRPRLPRLRIEVSPAARVSGLEIKRDGVVVGEPQWGVSIPIDLGKHTVLATAGGKKPWSLEVDVQQEAQAAEVVVPALADLPPPPPPIRAEKRPLPPPPPPPPPATPPQRIAGWAVTIAGAGAIGASFVLGGLAIAKKGESNEGGCDEATNVCNAAGVSLRESALGLATGSTVAFFGGLVAAGTGVALIATSAPKKRGSAAPSIAVHPSGASLTWRW